MTQWISIVREATETFGIDKSGQDRRHYRAWTYTGQRKSDKQRPPTFRGLISLHDKAAVCIFVAFSRKESSPGSSMPVENEPCDYGNKLKKEGSRSTPCRRLFPLAQTDSCIDKKKPPKAVKSRNPGNPGKLRLSSPTPSATGWLSVKALKFQGHSGGWVIFLA